MTMLSSGKSVVRVKNMLGDDVYGLWHVKKIVVQKGRQRYAIIPHKETFSTKDEAVHYAHLRTRRFVEHKLRENKNDTVRWRSVITYLLTAAFMSLMTAVAVRWFRD
jgi:hypothetical protein